MNGPRIIEQPTAIATTPRARTEGRTGVRATASGWVAIQNGRLVGGPHRGSRGFLQATREAGTTDVIR